MNCDTLSLSGERNVFATAIFLLLQTQNPTSGEWNTSLENIYDIFLERTNLETTLTESSSNPVTAAAIATWVNEQLLAYRRLDTLIPMDQVANLFTYLTNYRLTTNQIFTDIVTNTLAPCLHSLILNTNIQKLIPNINT